MSDDMKTVSIPTDSMATGKFLRHTGLVPSRFAASLVSVGALLRVNNGRDPGEVKVGDVITLAHLPTDGASTSWEPEDVVTARVVRG
jgi:hypothetical protein